MLYSLIRISVVRVIVVGGDVISKNRWNFIFLNSKFTSLIHVPHTENASLRISAREVRQYPVVVERHSISSIAQVVRSTPVCCLQQTVCHIFAYTFHTPVFNDSIWEPKLPLVGYSGRKPLMCSHSVYLATPYIWLLIGFVFSCTVHASQRNGTTCAYAQYRNFHFQPSPSRLHGRTLERSRRQTLTTGFCSCMCMKTAVQIM